MPVFLRHGEREHVAESPRYGVAVSGHVSAFTLDGAYHLCNLFSHCGLVCQCRDYNFLWLLAFSPPNGGLIEYLSSFGERTCIF